MGTQADVALLKKIALPSRMAVAFSRPLLSQDFDVFPYVLHLEQEAVGALLEAEKTKGKRGILVSVPPQVGKSTWWMWFIAWTLMMNPTKRVIFVTYSQQFSSQWGRRIRTLVEHLGPRYFNVQIDPENMAAHDWGMKGTTGGMLSVGIDGGITGRSGDIIIVDDVIKNMEEATSDAALKKHWKEFNASILPRVQDGGLLIVSATRWADKDLQGQIIEMLLNPVVDDETEADTESLNDIEWKRINIKAIAEPSDDEEVDDRDAWRDCLGRKVGEELTCRRHKGHFGGQKRSLYAGGDTFTWHSLYQGEPIVVEGSSFPPDKWGDFDPNDFDRVWGRVRVWDLAATEGGGDWTVGSLWGRIRDELVVLDVQRFRKDAPGVREEIVKTARVDGSGVPIYMEKERSGSGKSIVDLYKADPDLQNFLVEGLRPDGTKFTRAKLYSNVQNRGRVLLPPDAHWRTAWIREHSGMMPDGRMPRFDDQIDTGSYAVQVLIGEGDSQLLVPNAEELMRAQTEELAAQAIAGFEGMLDGSLR